MTNVNTRRSVTVNHSPNYKKKHKKNGAYQKLVTAIMVIFSVKLLGICGLVNWRTECDGHWIYIFRTAKEALDNNTVFDGIRLINHEFIIDLFNLGGWIKYWFLFGFMALILSYLPTAVKKINKIFRPDRKLIHFAVQAVRLLRSASAERCASAVKAFVKYGIIVSADSPGSVSRSVGFSVIINDREYYGGVVADGVTVVRSLHLISADGTETDHIFPEPLTVIAGKKRIFLCGSFTDSNGTRQRKKSLSTLPETVSSGFESYSVNINTKM
ncbi:MAG: hypothetical protein Q4A05_09035 [Ruminococcus sp.]|nr:hypothetical protein [Ruminococcus sp.]